MVPWWGPAREALLGDVVGEGDRRGRRGERDGEDADRDEPRDGAGEPRHPRERLAVPDRALDEGVRRRGDGQGDREAQGEQRRGVEARVGVVQPQEQREVVQVDPVGDPPDVGDLAQREHPRRPAVGYPDRGGDRYSDDRADDHVAAAVQRRTRARDRGQPGDDERPGEHPGHVARASPRRGRAVEGRTAIAWCSSQEHARARCAEEHRRRVGLGREVQGVDAHALREAHRAERGAPERPEDAAHREDVAAVREASQRDEEDGPHEVELLFDRERPGVLQRRGREPLGEVGRVRGDERPVPDVGHRAHDLAGERREAPAGDRERRVGADERHEHHEPGQQPACASLVEPPERQAAVMLELHEQQRGDEEARQHEEHVDAEEPAAHRHPAVVQHDRGDGERSHAVERRDVAQRRPSRSRRIDGRRVRHAARIRRATRDAAGRSESTPVASSGSPP